MNSKYIIYSIIFCCLLSDTENSDQRTEVAPYDITDLDCVTLCSDKTPPSRFVLMAQAGSDSDTKVTNDEKEDAVDSIDHLHWWEYFVATKTKKDISTFHQRIVM